MADVDLEGLPPKEGQNRTFILALLVLGGCSSSCFSPSGCIWP
jgi:hypothetical protein